MDVFHSFFVEPFNGFPNRGDFFVEVAVIESWEEGELSGEGKKKYFRSKKKKKKKKKERKKETFFPNGKKSDENTKKELGELKYLRRS